MFNIDLWQEIYGTVRRNKLRTFLTSLAVAWGIFMLVVLLAAGKGLQNGIEYQFRDDAVNSIWIWPSKTSIPWQGQPIGREIQLTNDDFDAIKRLPGVDHITGRVYLWNEGAVVRGDKKSAFDIRSVHPDHRYLENTLIISGRYIDDLDLRERRKVAVIGDEVRDFLFEKGEDPIGQWITIHDLQYQVIGVFQDEGGAGERRKIFIPISTAQMAYGGAQGGSNRINQIMLTVGTADIAASKRLEDRILQILADKHHFSPEDKRALRINNNLENFGQMQNVFTILKLFVWVVGALTILAGIVGVSNIMLISVKERTREIGIRKSFGATPGSILRMVTQEALVLTAVAGYLGLAAGVGLIELVTSFLPPIDFFRDPQVDIGVALMATGLLVVSGTLAGFFPAWRAARINPIQALRDE
ncbi:MAG TPA: ABC transporter permease [Kofleriaceae bacterium]|nr:ABC transporter permease [Kofleriaceae bacterium]